MRFTLAAAILAESSLATLASTDEVLKRATKFISNGQSRSGSGRLLSIGDHAGQTDGVVNTEKDVVKSLLKKFSGGLSMSSPIKKTLKNSHLQKPKLSECVPQGDDASVPDEGILSCGPGQYCMESVDSGLGGLCFESSEHVQRLLQNQTVVDGLLGLCADDSTNPNVTCSVCEADATTYTGTLDCVTPSSCDMIYGVCDGSSEEACSGGTLKFDISAPGIYSFESCISVEKPFEFAYCLGFTYNVDVASCELSINGVACTSCEPAYDPVDKQACQVFNCENTDLQSSGSTCGLSLLEAAIIDHHYGSLPCPDGCNLCGDGGFMENRSDNFTLSDGYSLNCLRTQLSAMTGYFTGTSYCTDLAVLVQEPCGCTAGVPAPPSTAPPTTAPVGGGGGVPTPSAPPSGAFSTSIETAVSMLGFTAFALAGLLV